MASHAGFDDGVAGDGKEKAIDDDATQLLALRVDALSEGGGADGDGAGSVPELLEQDVAGPDDSAAVRGMREPLALSDLAEGAPAAGGLPRAGLR